MPRGANPTPKTTRQDQQARIDCRCSISRSHLSLPAPRSRPSPRLPFSHSASFDRRHNLDLARYHLGHDHRPRLHRPRIHRESRGHVPAPRPPCPRIVPAPKLPRGATNSPSHPVRSTMASQREFRGANEEPIQEKRGGDKHLPLGTAAIEVQRVPQTRSDGRKAAAKGNEARQSEAQQQQGRSGLRHRCTTGLEIVRGRGALSERERNVVGKRMVIGPG